MQIDDRLQICLLALASRYPDHVVDINEAVLGPQSFGAEGWTSLDVIEMLESARPDLLQAMAQLVVDTQKSEIYLYEQSMQLPAFVIHCRGKLPSYRGNVIARQQLMSQTGQEVHV